MKKILIGLVAAIVIAVGGFFGFEFYVQHRVAGEVEAAFEQIRATGGKASHGNVSFDRSSRTVVVADIAIESAAQPPISVKIASVTASGVAQPDPTRFSADSFEIADILVDAGLATQTGLRLTYKVPRISVKDYSGPAGLHRPPASAAALELYRSALEQFATVSASSITAPSVVGTVDFGIAGSGSSEFAYSDVALEDIKNGKIATMRIGRVAFTANVQQLGKSEKLTGEMVDVASQDFDAAAVAAILDPQKANDDHYYRAYGRTTASAYTISFAQGARMRIEGMTIDDVGLRPSRLQLPALLAMIPPPGAAPPTPAQAREVIERAARIYEGIRIGSAEIRGISIETPQGPFKLSTIRFDLENGKIGEFAIEGLEVNSPKGPVKVGRFALKSIDLANLLRLTAQFSNPAQKPSPDQFLALLPLLEGVDVKGVVAPFKDTGKLVNLDTFSLNWGQFVGPIPTKARLTTKLSGPVDASDPTMQPLVAAGIDTLTAEGDIGATWTEAARTFVLDPVTFEVGSILKASARISLANVPRQVFSLNPQQAVIMASQIEAGAIELTVRDVGGVDLVVGEYARMQNVSRDAARQAIVDSIKASGEKAAGANADANTAVEALVRFVETPRQTLIIKLTPLGKVPAMQLVQLLKSDPITALSQFRVEASTGL